MKILFFVSSLHAGGAERVASTLACAWAQRGEDVTLVPSYTKKGSRFYALDRDVKLVWLADRMGFHLGPVLAGVKKLFAIRRLIREERPDVIISFLTNVNVMVLLGARGLGVPTIVCERTNPAVSSSAGRLLRRLRRMTYPWADMVTVQTDASVEALRAITPGIRDLAVIPNPLPVELLGMPAPGALPAPSERRRLIAMGRLVPAKGFAALIDAFARIAPDHAEWDLFIYGEGPLRESLQQQIDEAGLAERAFLPGRTAEPWQELAASQIFALSSEVEGFPNVLLEAMALGLACVAVDCPSGPREITRDGEDALLVPPGDAHALAQALTQLMGDPVLCRALGRRAAESVRGRYGPSEILAQWDELIARAREPGVHSKKVGPRHPPAHPEAVESRPGAQEGKGGA